MQIKKRSRTEGKIGDTGKRENNRWDDIPEEAAGDRR